MTKADIEGLIERLNGPVRKAAQAFIDHYFNNDGDDPEITIPADESNSDIVLCDGIKQAADALLSLSSERDALAAEVKRLRAEREPRSMDSAPLEDRFSAIVRVPTQEDSADG